MTYDDVTELAVDDVRRLPFVQEKPDGELSFWFTEGVGDQDADIGLGEMYGRLALTMAKEADAPLLICQIMADIIKGGQLTGVEAGFLAVIACTARAGAMN